MIENKIASNSKLLTLDLTEEISAYSWVFIDLKNWLWQGVVLKEVEFRKELDGHNWGAYSNTFVIIHCSVEAIIPTWAYMLLASKLNEYARGYKYADDLLIEEQQALLIIENLELDRFKGKNVVVKGCSNLKVSANVYVQIQQKLQPVANRIMFGEPCSTVPIFKL